MAEKEHQIVAAIDFGTTFSGYAFSFTSNKEAIYVNKNWGHTQGFQLHKTPTCLLLKPDGQFEAFGFEAVSRYNDLPDDEVANYYYYDRFKMKLYNNKSLNAYTVIEDVNGKTQLAVDVFAKSLNYFKKHVLRAINAHLGYDPNPDTIRWVLTVPAIWEENAKQFMREAAYRASLISKTNSKQLVIALEPEAASLHCRHLQVTDFVGNKDNALAVKPTFEPGTKYIVIDAGGGTIDVVAHEVITDKQVGELFQVTGGAWGGITIDLQFQNLMDKIFGTMFMAEFKRAHPNDYLELIQDFEIKKRGECESIRVSLPYNFCNFKYKGMNFQQAIKAYAIEYNNEVKFSSGKLVLTLQVVNSLFTDTLSQINDHIEGLLKKSEIKDLKYIFLVGGFAESTRLQNSLMTQFRGRVKVFVPEEASLAVVRGAVTFGHNPSSIYQRICRFTYGTDCCEQFEKGKHREDLKFTADDDTLCKNIFHTWAEAGEIIPHNKVWHGSYCPVHTNQKRVRFDFFRSNKKNIKYCDEEGMEKCGSLVVEMPDLTGDKKRSVDLEVTFGGTELKVVGTDSNTKKKYDTYIDFLSN